MVSAVAFVVPSKGAPFQQVTVKLNELQPSEVLVELKATGICHTDLAVQQGRIPVPFPVILGHEGAGIVLAVGTEVVDIRKGDHVILSYNHCGSCHSCWLGRTWHCSKIHAMNFGGQRPDGSQTAHSESGPLHSCFFGQSSFCNPAVVQSASCVKVNPELPLSVICALGCGSQTGAGSVFNVVKPVERKVRHLAIFGAGGVGFAALMAAVHLANENPGVLEAIIAVDVNDERLELAKELGATHIINLLDDRIVSLFDGSNVTIPEGTEEINIAGKIIRPGFVDTHRHSWETAFKTIASNTSLSEYFVRYSEFPSQDKFTAEDVYIGQLAGLL
ncbi:hypothetical protein FOVSG1_013406 [Fusarium oxysporum f. sp. vasinfectum]